MDVQPFPNWNLDCMGGEFQNLCGNIALVNWTRIFCTGWGIMNHRRHHIVLEKNNVQWKIYLVHPKRDIFVLLAKLE